MERFGARCNKAMKTFIFIMFLIGNFLIFNVESSVFELIFSIMIFVVLLWKRRLISYAKFLLKSSPFILAMFLCNLLLSGFDNALFVSKRFLVSLSLTYLLTCFLSLLDIGHVLGNFLRPLRVFGINTEKIVLIISVALTFVPVLISEGKILRKALIMKGYRPSLKNAIFEPDLFVAPFFNNIFNKIETMEKALLMKGLRL